MSNWPQDTGLLVVSGPLATQNESKTSSSCLETLRHRTWSGLSHRSLHPSENAVLARLGESGGIESCDLTLQN